MSDQFMVGDFVFVDTIRRRIVSATGGGEETATPPPGPPAAGGMEFMSVVGYEPGTDSYTLQRFDENMIPVEDFIPGFKPEIMKGLGCGQEGGNGEGDGNAGAGGLAPAIAGGLVLMDSPAAAASALDELMRRQWERGNAASMCFRWVIRFRVDNNRWPTRAEITSMMTAANLPISILGSLPDIPGDSEASDETAWVIHTSRTDRYHDPDCANAKGGKRVTLAVAKQQLNSQPAKCCRGKKSCTPT